MAGEAGVRMKRTELGRPPRPNPSRHGEHSAKAGLVRRNRSIGGSARACPSAVLHNYKVPVSLCLVTFHVTCLGWQRTSVPGQSLLPRVLSPSLPLSPHLCRSLSRMGVKHPPCSYTLQPSISLGGVPLDSSTTWTVFDAVRGWVGSGTGSQVGDLGRPDVPFKQHGNRWRRVSPLTP